MTRGLLRATGLLAAGACLIGGWTIWRIWDEAARDDPRSAGAIVVLGAAQYDGRPSPVFAARLDHAIDLYLAGRAPVLVVTGGKQPGDRTTEAATARGYAVRRGVPEAAILLEDEGRTTVESISSVARILAAAGIPDALFVSDPTHMLRVLLIARDEGVEADPLRRLRATIHEVGALAQYLILGRTGLLGLP
jgi:uncharacterized SAM-binding protein YcdF (DUF218 family)